MRSVQLAGNVAVLLWRGNLRAETSACKSSSPLPRPKKPGEMLRGLKEQKLSLTGFEHTAPTRLDKKLTSCSPHVCAHHCSLDPRS